MGSSVSGDKMENSAPEMLFPGEDVHPKLAALLKDPHYRDLTERMLKDLAYMQLKQLLKNVYLCLCSDRLAKFDAPVYVWSVQRFFEQCPLISNFKQFGYKMTEDLYVPGTSIKIENPPYFDILREEIQKETPNASYRDIWLHLVEVTRRMIPDDNTPDPEESNDSEEEYTDEIEYVFHYYACVGDFESLENAVLSGAEVNELDWKGRTALHIACAKGQVKCAEFLIARGVAVSVVDAAGDTALHYAAAFGWEQCAELLLKHDADLTIRNSNGSSPLDVAVFRNKIDVVKLLVAKGA